LPPPHGRMSFITAATPRSPPPPRGRDRSSSGTGEHRRSSNDRPGFHTRPPTSTHHRFQFTDQRDHDRHRAASPKRSRERGVSENQSFKWQKTTPKRSKSTDGHAHALPASSEYKHRGSPSQPSGSRKRHRTPSPERPAKQSRRGKERMRSPSPTDSVIDVSSDNESQVPTESEDDDPPPRRVSLTDGARKAKMIYKLPGPFSKRVVTDLTYPRRCPPEHEDDVSLKQIPFNRHCYTCKNHGGHDHVRTRQSRRSHVPVRARPPQQDASQGGRRESHRGQGPSQHEK
jgi:hypothetical protein